MSRARPLRDRALATALPRYAGGQSFERHQAFVAKEGKAWFDAVRPLLDSASGIYARAFFAKNAAAADRIVAMSEAADLHVTLANRLLELGTLPRAWRTDARSAFTFEEFMHGPQQQWKAAAMGLAARCVELARTEHLEGPSVIRCRDLGKGREPRSASGACCAPMDPLCSAMTEWCKD